VRENNNIIVYMIYKYLLIFLLLTLLGKMYDKYKLKEKGQELIKHEDIVKKYLLNDNAITGRKPILWVHIDSDINSRKWESFGSRNTREVNEPYKILTLQSIIKQSGDDFNICLIDDDSFIKLMPSWSIDLNKLSNPIKCYMRSLALMNLLYNYGGFLVPNSYLALKNLSGLYDTGLNEKDCFVLETLNKNISSTYENKFPNHLFIGCEKGSKNIKELIHFIEYLNSRDFTNEQKFLGEVDKKCYEMIKENKITLLDAKLIGCLDENNKPVIIDNLLESSYINFSNSIQGILIPDKDILKRIKYQWFARMSIEQVLDANIILSKYILLSL
jgi:hypothetical protein